MKKNVVFLFLLLSSPLFAQRVDIVFKRSFINELATKTSLTVDYIVDKSHPRPNAPSKDADLHFAGRSTAIGMNSVAEIMNARTVPSTVDYIKALQGTDQKINISGAWRIWCEHPNEQDQFIQSATVNRATSTNPPHIFEIHPVTAVGNTDITSTTLRHISGYKYKKAEDAFARYTATPFEIKKLSGGRVRLMTNGVGYNYVKFKMVMLDEQPYEAVDGGSFALFQVLSDDEEVIVPKLRMVFMKGSQPHALVKSMPPDSVITVVGIPRISASLIKWRLENYSKEEYADALTWSLPYEMIVVAVLNEDEAREAEELLISMTNN